MNFRATIPAVSLLLLTGACATEGPATKAAFEVKNTGTPGMAEASRSVSGKLTITAIDLATRQVTLKDPATGETQTLTAGPQVKRLAEAKVGDSVAVEYQEGLMLEFQAPGTDSVEPTAVAVAGRAEKAAGGVVAAGVQATVTVMAIDLKSRLTTLQTPNGTQYKVKAGPNVQLDKLKVGDRLLATYVQAVAVSLEKQ
jgi:hypothetical protein